MEESGLVIYKCRKGAALTLSNSQSGSAAAAAQRPFSSVSAITNCLEPDHFSSPRVWNMCAFRLGFLFIYSLVFFRLNAALSLDRTHAAVTPGQLTHTQNKAQTIEHQHPDLDEYEDEHYEDDFSGDHNLEYPRVEFSSKPRNSDGVPKADSTKKPRRMHNNRRKNLCLRKRNENYCINGVCEYLVQLKEISCRCKDGYTGERCQHLILLVGTIKEDQYNHITLAIVASVLSVLSLIIIGVLLIVRHYKRNNCEGEEKIRLEASPVQ